MHPEPRWAQSDSGESALDDLSTISESGPPIFVPVGCDILPHLPTGGLSKKVVHLSGEMKIARPLGEPHRTQRKRPIGNAHSVVYGASPQGGSGRHQREGRLRITLGDQRDEMTPRREPRVRILASFHDAHGPKTSRNPPTSTTGTDTPTRDQSMMEP